MAVNSSAKIIKEGDSVKYEEPVMRVILLNQGGIIVRTSNPSGLDDSDNDNDNADWGPIF